MNSVQTPKSPAAACDLYEKVSHVVPEIEWAVHAPYIDAINRLKKAAKPSSWPTIT